MAMPKEFIDFAAAVARDRSPVLIDAVASGQSYLLGLLKQSGPKRKVTVDLPEELDVDHVFVEMTWFDEESNVVRVAPLRIQKRPEGNSTSTGLDEGENKRLKRVQERRTLLDSVSDSYHDICFGIDSDKSVESGEVLEERVSVTKGWEEEDFIRYKNSQLGTKRPLASWSVSDHSTLSTDIDVTPAKSSQEKDKGFFRLMVGGESDSGTTDLSGQVALSWNLHCVRDTDKIVLSMSSFSVLAATEGSKYFLTQWDVDVLGQDGWLPESWSPKDRRTDGRVVGTQSSHVTFSSVARASEAPFEAGIKAGLSRRYHIDRRQRPWWVGASPSLFSVSGIGWMWKTTAWTDMSKRTNMQEDALSVQYCRGKVSPTKLTIELDLEERPEAVFRNKNNPQPVPVFDIKTTAMYRYRSGLLGRFKLQKVRRKFRVVIVG